MSFRINNDKRDRVHSSQKVNTNILEVNEIVPNGSSSIKINSSLVINSSSTVFDSKTFNINSSSVIINSSSTININSSLTIINSSSIIINSSSTVINSSSVIINSSTVINGTLKIDKFLALDNSGFIISNQVDNTKQLSLNIGNIPSSTLFTPDIQYLSGTVTVPVEAVYSGIISFFNYPAAIVPSPIFVVTRKGHTVNLHVEQFGGTANSSTAAISMAILPEIFRPYYDTWKIIYINDGGTIPQAGLFTAVTTGQLAFSNIAGGFTNGTGFNVFAFDAQWFTN